jgi:hypothetical protein
LVGTPIIIGTPTSFPAPEFPMGTILGIVIPLAAIVTYGVLGRKFSHNYKVS